MRAKLGALAAIAVAAMSSAALGAPQRHHQRSAAVLNPSGTLMISWAAVASRGCAEVGACGVSGSVEVVAASQANSSESPPRPDIELDDYRAVARVRNADGGVCADLVPVSFVLTVDRGHHRARPAVGQLPSSGRCAGPTPADLSGLVLPARRLPGRNEAYDLSGTVAIGAGPYLVKVVSTIRARRPAGQPGVGAGPFPPPPIPPDRPRLLESVAITYRYRSAMGQLTTSFAGRSAPPCEVFDACGTTGSLNDLLTLPAGTLRLFAGRIVHHRVSPAQALRDLRAGRLRFEFGQVNGVVSGDTVENYGGNEAHCSASARNQLGFYVSQLGRSVNLSLIATSNGDPFRTWCPGPASSDVTESADGLASGSLPMSRLGDRHARIAVARGFTRFIAGGYAGTTHGGLQFVLTLAGVHAGTHKAAPGMLLEPL